MKSCLFIVCKTMFTIGESQAFLMQTEQQTQERRIVNPRRGRFDTEKSSGAKNADLKFNGASSKDGWRRQQQTAEQRTSLNEFQMLKFFKSKWKQFWIISLINIWANIAVTKPLFLADEFVPYRPTVGRPFSTCKWWWNAFTLGIHCSNCSHSSEKYLWTHV